MHPVLIFHFLSILSKKASPVTIFDSSLSLVGEFCINNIQLQHQWVDAHKKYGVGACSREVCFRRIGFRDKSEEKRQSERTERN